MNERRKPWRREVVLVAALTIGIAVAGWLKVGSVASDIQKSRRDAIVQACQETNQRHDNTIAALNDLAAQAIADHPEDANRIRQSTTSSTLLIDALAPVYDCEQRAAELADQP